MTEEGKKTNFLKMGKEHYLFLCSVLFCLLRFVRLSNCEESNLFAGQ